MMAEFSRVSGGHGARAGGKNDYYPTRPAVVRALLEVEDFPNRVWEPACGAGHLAEELRRHRYRVVASDLEPRGYGSTRPIDFLALTKAPANVRSLVTNPPFRLAREFVLKALELGIEKHAWLLRLQFAEGGRRYRELLGPHPPARVWVFSSRVQVNADHPGGDRGGEICFSWWVWESRRELRAASTELRWLPPG